MLVRNETRVRVATYNILSSALTQGHTLCNPDDLAEQTRLARLYSKLDTQISENAVICLQEVSQDWIGPLTAYFAQRNYHLTIAQYGNYWNNYMGVGVAYPWNEFELVRALVKKPVNEKKWPKAPQVHFLKKWVNLVLEWIAVWNWWKKVEPSPWDEAYRRWNTMIIEHLRCKKSKVEFCVGTYHNPCAFKNPVSFFLK
jgi:hypothetical protein